MSDFGGDPRNNTEDLHKFLAAAKEEVRNKYANPKRQTEPSVFSVHNYGYEAGAIYQTLRHGKQLEIAEYHKSHLLHLLGGSSEDCVDTLYQEATRSAMLDGEFPSDEMIQTWSAYSKEECLREALTGVDYYARVEALEEFFSVESELEDDPIPVPTLREILNDIFNMVGVHGDEYERPPMFIWLEVLQQYPLEAVREVGALLGSPILPRDPHQAAAYLATHAVSADPYAIANRLAAVAAQGYSDDFSLTGYFENKEGLIETISDALLLFVEDGEDADHIARLSVERWDFSNHW